MFEITIKEIKTETKTVRGEWVVLRKHLVTEAELEKSAYAANTSAREKFLNGEVVLMQENGYAPDKQEDVESQHEIYTQRVNNLDLPAVIKAINGI